MRFVVFGAGAIGGVLGARLHAAGHDVVLIARGPHLDAIRERGLRVLDPSGDHTFRIPAVADPRELALGADDVVLLAVKSQGTLGALEALDDSGVAVVCVQNGVANERESLRRFERVYGVCVMCPGGHLEPGVVIAPSAPITGLLDIGRFPAGADDLVEQIADAFRSATYESVVRPDIMRWKYRKLLVNLSNAVEALCGRDAIDGELAELARAEGEACLQAAEISYISAEEDEVRRADKIDSRPVRGAARIGSSTVQDLARGTGAVETDYFNGEIALLGRLHRVPTPANVLLPGLMGSLVRGEREPGSFAEAELLARLR
jgi:2-dehydropantoate 2-reductase